MAIFLRRDENVFNRPVKEMLDAAYADEPDKEEISTVVLEWLGLFEMDKTRDLKSYGRYIVDILFEAGLTALGVKHVLDEPTRSSTGKLPSIGLIAHKVKEFDDKIERRVMVSINEKRDKQLKVAQEEAAAGKLNAAG